MFKEFRIIANRSASDKSAYAKERNIPLARSRIGWAYEWVGNGMLEKVITPNDNEVTFAYGSLGRCITKQHKGSIKIIGKNWASESFQAGIPGRSSESEKKEPMLWMYLIWDTGIRKSVPAMGGNIKGMSTKRKITD